MDQPARAPGRSAAPWGLVGMLVLLVAAELFVAHHGDKFLTIFQLDWQTSGRAAYRKARRHEILCFGDSMLKFGLCPRVVRRETGRTAYSFALLDGKPPASYYLFRRAIEGGARPSAVLVDFQPECMFQDPRHLLENQHWTSLLNPREIADLSWNYWNPTFLARAAVSYVLPSVRCRNEIRLNVTSALNGSAPPNVEENAKVTRNWRENRGGLILAKYPAYKGEVTREGLEVLCTDLWKTQPENGLYVRRFFALASAHHIPVYWVLPPNAPRVQQAREASGLSTNYTLFVREALEAYPNLRVIDARTSGFGHDVFVDAVHLDRDGNAALSLGVSEILRRDLATNAPLERWTALARHRDRPLEIALEDVEQSRAIVRQQAERRIR